MARPKLTVVRKYPAEAIAVTDWNAWLEANEPHGPNELLAPHDAVVYGGDLGCYVGTHDSKGRVFIKGWTGQQVALVSEKAIRTFLRVIEEGYASGMDIEAFHGLEVAIARDRS